ncbi:beta-L-arabinofuranosidase domain-containing protein [Rathayibacter sp. SD072]|uniref:glycoside hydrolase family 127 protein n=1 Tax=Rathayibacter sp. SD072 TaxID=2781731 RepID=UPI001A971B6C|nr:beta-L-arabinofuranosidase domain-containing protein [Rathayibacter sp. SD072]MBO0985819.1 glycoside hydrolase family 127 protein [Rathayibacter sp. SD072]
MTTTSPTPTLAPATASALGGPVAPSSGRLRPLGQHEIRLTGGFWKRYQELGAGAVIGHCLSWIERVGWAGNFDRAADGTISDASGDHHAGIEFVDSEVYKLLEAMAWELGRSDDAELAASYEALVARVAAAQEEDGYLHTSFGRPGQPARYSNLEWGHELYSFGHLIQAAVARLRTGHDDLLPAVARRLTEHVWREFGPEGRVAVCGHPEIEPALAELARATGEGRWLELARLFVERRGTGTLGPVQFGAEYFQDDVPVREADVLRGHAVRALYLASGALDVAVETDDAELEEAVRRQWSSTVARRTYITGGMGSHHQDEAFGADYELPPDRAYAETCAAIASDMLSWRLLLRSGETAHADLMERTLLNAVLPAIRADGRAFFYTNTLQQRADGVEPDESVETDRAQSSLRAPWFWVSCCPTNTARTLASVELGFATADDEGVQLHQYGAYRVETDGIALQVETEYPADGEIVVRIEEDAEFALTLRIPPWARGSALLDGAPVEASLETVTVRRAFRAGETVRLSLPMTARFVTPHPRIDAVRGQVALERGPFVLAIESVDLPEGLDTEHLAVDRSVEPVVTPDGARVALAAVSAGEAGWAYGAGSALVGERFEAEFRPYYTWANRGPSTMRIWTPAL